MRDEDFVRDRLGLVCEQLSRWPKVEGIVRGAGGGEALDALLAALATDTAPNAERLDEWISAIEDAARRAGLQGIASRFRQVPTEPAEEWGCPRGHCDRLSSLSEIPEAPSACWIAGSTPLRKIPTYSA